MSQPNAQFLLPSLNPDGAMRTMCLLPEELCTDLYIQFEGSDTNSMAKEPAIQVDVTALRRAIWWYATHCYQWLEATKQHELFAYDNLGNDLEKVLQAYRKSMHGAAQGVPQTLTQVATSLPSEKLVVQHRGPADNDDDSNDSSDSQRSDKNERQTSSLSMRKKDIADW